MGRAEEERTKSEGRAKEERRKNEIQIAIKTLQLYFKLKVIRLKLAHFDYSPAWTPLSFH